MPSADVVTLNFVRILDNIGDLKTFHKNAQNHHISYLTNAGYLLKASELKNVWFWKKATHCCKEKYEPWLTKEQFQLLLKRNRNLIYHRARIGNGYLSGAYLPSRMQYNSLISTNTTRAKNKQILARRHFKIVLIFNKVIIRFFYFH